MKFLNAQSLADHMQRSGQFYYLITDTKGQLIQVNELFSKKSGINTDDISSYSLAHLLTEEEKTKCETVVKKCLDCPGDIGIIEFIIRSADGSSANISWELSSMLGGEDVIAAIQWIGKEAVNNKSFSGESITEWWERYEAYEFSSEGIWKVNLRTPVSVNLSPDEIINHCRKNGYLADCNDKMARMYGFAKAGELIGATLDELMDLEDPERIGNLKKLIVQDFHSINVETKEYDRHGNTLYIMNNMRGIIEDGMLKRIWGTQQDITEKRKAEDQLQQSEIFHRNLIADSLDGMFLTNKKGIISFSSASVEKILGYEPGEVNGKNVIDFLHPDDRVGIPVFFQETEQTADSNFLSVRLLQKSGEWLSCMVRSHNLLGNPIIGAVLIYFCDDTLRKNAETALIESEQRFRHLIRDLSLGVILVNEKGEILICNRATADMFETSEDQLVGRNILHTARDIIHEDGNAFLAADFPVAIAIRSKKTVRNIVMGVKRLSDDRRMWLLISAEPVLDTKGNILHIISSFTDITEQKRFAVQLVEQEIQKQKQLMQATIDGQENERREIGRELHDNISQHLTTTRLYLEVAKDKAEGEVLKMINQAHKGMLDIVSAIRQISQSLVPPSLSDIGLIESVEDLCEPLKNTHAFAIDFQYHQFDEAVLPENMKLMLFRIIQEQVNNIVRHANTQNIIINLQTISSQVSLTVSDNGKGFDPATVKKGLGFDNINNRVGLFGGKLILTSSPGKGCRIHVTIPLPSGT